MDNTLVAEELGRCTVPRAIRRRAALTVANAAIDPQDCAVLLDSLGLLGPSLRER